MHRLVGVDKGEDHHLASQEGAAFIKYIDRCNLLSS